MRWQRVMAACVLGAAVVGGMTAWGATPDPKKTGAATKSTTTMAATKPGKSGPTATQQASTQQAASRVRARLDEVERQIAELLTTSGPKVSKDPRSTAAKISYRMIVRRLYELAAGAKGDELRPLLALKADTLLDGAEAFDGLVDQAPKWQAIAAVGPEAGAEQQKLRARMNAAMGALADFEKAAAKANQPLENAADLRKYLAEMLTPLQAIVAVELVDRPMPVAWPLPASNHAEIGNSVALPAIEKTITHVQEANLQPPIRAELQAILPALRERLAATETVEAARQQYELILDCLSLGEQIGASSMLNIKAREDLNQQLRLGLVLFKDARTRPSALDRLSGVGNVASILMHLDKSPLTQMQKEAVGAAMQAAVLKLSTQTTAKAGRVTLSSLDKFLTAYERFIKASDQPAGVTMKDEWKKIKTGGDTVVTAAIEGVTLNPENPVVDEFTKRLVLVRQNFDRLAAMPAALKTAEGFKPRPTGGVDKKLILWARVIADSPDAPSTGAVEFDAFRDALALLAETRAASQVDLPETLTNKLTGERYKKFLEKFQLAEQTLVNSLAAVNVPSGPLVKDLQTQYRLLRVLQDLEGLEQDDTVLPRLNRWGAWHLDEQAGHMLLGQFDLALATEFANATGGASSVFGPTPPPTDTTWLTFGPASAAISNLAEIQRRVGDKLTGDTGLWATTFAQVGLVPDPDAALVLLADKLAIVDFELNEAACNEEHEVLSIAQTRIQKGVEVLGGLSLPPER